MLKISETNAQARKEYGDRTDNVLPVNYKESILDSMREAKKNFVNLYNRKEKYEKINSNVHGIVRSSLQRDSKFWDSI
jgi:hypothetical protein